MLGIWSFGLYEVVKDDVGFGSGPLLSSEVVYRFKMQDNRLSPNGRLGNGEYGMGDEDDGIYY
jgi:hypothetical protein